MHIARLDPNKGSMDFYMIKKAKQSCDDTNSPQKYKKKSMQKCISCGTTHKLTDIQHLEKTAVHDMCQSNDEAEMLTTEFSIVTSMVFNFHSVISEVLQSKSKKHSEISNV